MQKEKKESSIYECEEQRVKEKEKKRVEKMSGNEGKKMK